MQDSQRLDGDAAERIERVRERASGSQLLTISEAAYAVGIERVERDIADPDMPPMAADHRCLGYDPRR